MVIYVVARCIIILLIIFLYKLSGNRNLFLPRRQLNYGLIAINFDNDTALALEHTLGDCNLLVHKLISHNPILEDNCLVILLALKEFITEYGHVYGLLGEDATLLNEVFRVTKKEAVLTNVFNDSFLVSVDTHLRALNDIVNR